VSTVDAINSGAVGSISLLSFDHLIVNPLVPFVVVVVVVVVVVPVACSRESALVIL
jgi:hypothetical protein